jgi:N-acetylmuramoyl-L-alanine amidase
MENRVSKLTKIVMVFKRIILIFILFTGVFVSLPSLVAQKVQRVVIDAGHGGHDPGAVGKFSKEKDITLSIALKTGNLIKEHLKDVEVIYTRKTDGFVELHRRARIANEAKADLFSLFIAMRTNQHLHTAQKLMLWAFTAAMPTWL